MSGYNRNIFLTLILFLISANLFSQDSRSLKEHHLFTDPQFFQVKDAFNYGLVFNGVNLSIGYLLEMEHADNQLSYACEAAFGAAFKKGAAFNINFKALDFAYVFGLNKEPAVPVYIGPYVLYEYNWQAYPELQSGHMFWFSDVEIGVRLRWEVPVKNRALQFIVSNSLAGATSRPVPETETHFYHLKFKDFLSNAHSNMQFGSFNQFNRTTFDLQVHQNAPKRFSFGYRFEYFGYYKDPKLSYISHAIRLQWQLGKIRIS